MASESAGQSESSAGFPTELFGSEDWLARAVVQESRAAATRGLLHDFGNVMVGLCSISENALEEVDFQHPLRDDLEIIRDSAFRAHHIIRRIVALNPSDPSESDLIDCETWLRGELETLRSVLPKGSEVRFDQTGETFWIQASDEALRDILLVIAHTAARRRGTRILLKVVTRQQGNQVEINLIDAASDEGRSGLDDVADAISEEDRYSCVTRFAASNKGSFTARSNDKEYIAQLRLPLAQ